MTDGPFRNLPLSGSWKKAADAIAHDAYSTEEVCRLIEKAMNKEIAKQDGIDAIESLKYLVIENGQLPLIAHNLSETIDTLRNKYAKTNFNISLFRHAEFEAYQGHLDYAGLQSAISKAVSDTIKLGLNNIQDHSLSVRNELDVSQVKERCLDVSRAIKPENLSQQILENGRIPVQKAPPKRIGIDDGVPL